MDCTTKNPLTRDGVSQNQRLLKALDPSYTKVDERSMFDLLQFLVDYAKEINYYNPDNEIDGNWKAFLEKDITVIISLIAKKDSQKEKDCFDNLLSIINYTAASETEIQNAFKTIFDLLFSILFEVDKWYKQTEEGLGIQATLKRLIGSQLKNCLNKLIGYYKGALKEPVLFDATYQIDEDECEVEITNASEILTKGLLEVWYQSSSGISYSDWNTYYTSITADNSIYGDERANPAILPSVKIKESLDKFQLVFDDIYNVLKQIILSAPDLAEETLTEYSAHEPHAGLILSFLQLFEYAQDHINTITEKHLEFYYEQVLKLTRLDAVPDKAHLIFELAKHVDSHKVAEGTLFKAGKDNLGNEVLYQSDHEKIINKASVSYLRSIYVDKENDWRVYASPIANSADGNGVEFEEDDAKWKAFGESQEGMADSSRTMPDAEIGFALTSPLLLLNEGQKLILISFTFKSNIPGTAGLISDLFDFSYTGEKGWVKKEDLAEYQFIAAKAGKLCNIVIALGEGELPVVNYSSKVHGGSFDSGFPMIKITANPNNADQYLYYNFRESKIDKVGLVVYGLNLKDLVVQNDNGVLDAAKPFQPFGPRPVKGSKFYIGCYEALKKKINALAVSLKWHNLPVTDTWSGQDYCYFSNYYNYNELPDSTTPYYSYEPSNSDFKAKLEILQNNVWKNLKSSATEKEQLFNTNAFIDKILFITKDNSTLGIENKTDLEEFSEYKVDLDQGFIRLVLDEPNDAFGHKLYTPILTKQAIAQKIDLPVEPYTPEVSEIRLSYMAIEEINLTDSVGFEKRKSKFYHLQPFGQQEIHKKLTGEDLYFLPQSSHIQKGETIRHTGEFFIGMKDLDPPQNLSILFKIAEDSADPTLVKQDVFWFYLVDDEWIEFELDEIVSDGTNGLLTTGIIEFKIPKAVSNQNSVLDSGYHWIKAAVIDNPASICDLIAIHAQAGQVSFKEINNDPDYLATALEKESIGKLKVKEAEIKSVTQPYASFGGSPTESDENFYRRISERLRHKNRAITIWDYERLVLEEFPEVYKAKCINHSTYDFVDSRGRTINSEFEPGSVTLIVVPELKNQNAVNPLEPRISLNTLDEIKTFLNQLNSPFAAKKLKVLNPLFEKIQVEFFVSLHDGYDEGFYKEQLKEDIKKFLSPWAYDEGEDIVFGGKLHKSVILDYIEERPFVDYVTDFKMNHYTESGETFLDISEAVATTARSILVSSDEHIIIENSTCE